MFSMSRFQIVFTAMFLVLGIAGIIMFAVNRGGSSSSAVKIIMWGSAPSNLMTPFLGEINSANRNSVNVSYVQKSKDSLESELIQALARGQGPDMILLPDNLILKQLDKFYIIPFESYSERTFKDSFIEGSEIYLSPSGIIGLPFSVDPLVMYWNRNIFSSSGISVVPSLWTEFHSMAPKIVKKDSFGNINQSFVAFGSMNNIENSKAVLSILALQAGTPIVSRDQSGLISAVFDKSLGYGTLPSEQAVNFFTEFSNPLKTSYSWNASMANDKSLFLGGRLAIYFGFASEIAGIRSANPNLNFDVAVVPQTGGKKMTYGDMNAIALIRTSPNIASAFTAAVALTNQSSQSLWIEKSGYPPIRRDLLAKLPGNAYLDVFYKSALMSYSWLDPDTNATKSIFSRMISNVTSGRYRTSEAVRISNTEISNLLR